MVSLPEKIGAAQSAALAEASVALGVFDGVHEGHRFLIESMRKQARACQRPSAIVTFDRDPDEVFCVAGFRKLTSDERRLELLADLGCDELIVLPFDAELAATEPIDFLEGLFRSGAPAAIHVGEGFRFGCHGTGDLGTLKRWAEGRPTVIRSHPLLAFDGVPVSATAIRALLSAGKVQEAAALLGRPYGIDAEVVHGRAEGREMGIRTANLIVAERLLALGDGVYGAYATVGDARYRAAVSVGVAPTFATARANVEAHLLDFDGDLYGQTIRLDFIAWLRRMRTFSSMEELTETIGANIQWVRENL